MSRYRQLRSRSKVEQYLIKPSLDGAGSLAYELEMPPSRTSEGLSLRVAYANLEGNEWVCRDSQDSGSSVVITKRNAWGEARQKLKEMLTTTIAQIALSRDYNTRTCVQVIDCETSRVLYLKVFAAKAQPNSIDQSKINQEFPITKIS